MDTIKKRIKDIEDKMAGGHRIRARIPKFEETEPNITYYAKLEKSKSQKNLIYSLYKKNGEISAGTDEVLATSKEFYSDLYKKGVDTTLQNKILKSLNTILSNVDKAECEKILQKPEIFDALTELPLGKTPGLDGLPVEFYRNMWSFIKDDYMTMVEQVYQTQNFSYTQRKGAIRLIFKKEDRYNQKNYRPVSLINVDVKIITKALAKRIGKVLPSFIYKNSTSIPGRNISYNIHNLIDIIKYANTKNTQAVILFLDQKKAFDRVNHDFLIKTLNHFNFGEYFTNWVKIMLKDITSQIKINGFLSEEIII